MTVDLERAEALEKEVVEAKLRTADLKSELEKVRAVVSGKEEDLHEFRRSVVFREPGGKAVILAFREGCGLSKEVCESLKTLRELSDELMLLKTEQTSEQAVVYNRARLKFSEIRKVVMKELAERELALKEERDSLERVQSAVDEAGQGLEIEKARFDAQASALAIEKAEFEAMANANSERRRQLAIDFAALRKEQGAVDREMETIARQLSKLESARQSRVSEFAKAESAIAQLGEIATKNEALAVDQARLAMRRSKLMEAKWEIETDRTEIERLLFLRKSTEVLRSRLTDRENGTVAQTMAEIKAETDRVRARAASLDEQIHGIEKAEADLSERRAAHDRETTEAKQIHRNPPHASIKSMFLQFFLQEGSAREELIPVILQLVGCTSQEIGIALRKWSESHPLGGSFWPF
jgi:hypothetical protein